MKPVLDTELNKSDRSEDCNKIRFNKHLNSSKMAYCAFCKKSGHYSKCCWYKNKSLLEIKRDKKERQN